MIELNGLWKMHKVGDTTYHSGNVPGSVYTDLLNNKCIKDPFYGENEDEIKALSQNDYEYERSFIINSSHLKNDKLVLVCEGLDTLADIIINGKVVASTDNMHRTYKIDIKQHIIIGLNTINIVFHSPLRYIEKEYNKKKIWGVKEAVPGYEHIRKAHCMFGWDWGPQLPDMGIWRSIYIEELSYGNIVDFYVRQKNYDGHSTITIEEENEFFVDSSDIKVKCTLLDKNNNVVSTNIHDSAEKLEFTLNIDNPELWWPNGYGDQPLYTVLVQMYKGDAIISEKKCKVGIRTFKIRRDNDKWGESFGFEVNGKVIFAKGANYIPEDNLLGRTSLEKTKKLLEDCAASNFNCIRVWGGGNYASDDFYDICDSLGLLVWQDFMFACGMYNLTDKFTKNIVAEFKDNICRLRNHASLFMWCGNNEMEEGWLHWGLPQDIKLKQDYTTQFERIIPESIEQYDRDRFYWPSSPSSGGGFLEPNSPDKGDVHYWDIWHGGKPFKDFEKKFLRFASEYGFQSIPSIKTMSTVIDKDQYNLFSVQMEKHQKCFNETYGNGNVVLMTYLSKYYMYPKNFESLIYATQSLQSDFLEAAIAHLRSHRGRCLGSTYWQVNDCNPVVSWATIDYYGRWKASHYIVKKRYGQLVVSAEDLNEDGQISFYVSSELQEEKNLEFFVKIINQDKGILKESNTSFTINELSSLKVFDIDVSYLSEIDKRDTYVYYGISSSNEVIDERVMLLNDPKKFSFRDPKIKVDITDLEDCFNITLESSEYARRVFVDFKDSDVILSDNTVDLIKNQRKTLVLSKNQLKDEYTAEALLSQLTIISNYDIAN